MSNENDTRIPIVTLLVTQRGEDFGCRGVAGGTPGLPFSLPYSKPLALNSKIRQSINSRNMARDVRRSKRRKRGLNMQKVISHDTRKRTNVELLSQRVQNTCIGQAGGT